MKNNIKEMSQLWNRILLEKKLEVCIKDFEGLGITDVQILKLIYSHPEYRIKQYLSVLKLPNSSFTNIINKLCSKGFVERVIDPSDLRSFGLRLTETGNKAVRIHIKAEEDKIEELLSKLTTDEQLTFSTLFKKIFD